MPSSLALFVFAILLTTTNQQQFLEGDPCGAESYCTRFEKCPGAIKDLRSGIYPKTCSFVGVTPIICCNFQIKNKPTKRPTTAVANIPLGDRCGPDSYCTKFDKCPGAQERLKNGIYPKTCSFLGLTPIICCNFKTVPKPIHESETNQWVRPSVPLGVGDLCGPSSFCTRFDSCPGAIERLKEGKYPKTCSINGVTPIVCCNLQTKRRFPRVANAVSESHKN